MTRMEPSKIASETGLYVVRLYDGFDHCWMDVSSTLPWEDTLVIWNEKTASGTKNTSYNDIDYYHIFPSDTHMLYSSDVPPPNPERLKGPLDAGAIRAFADHLTNMAGRPMAFDPDAAGTEVYDQNRGRYQFRVLDDDARGSDYQGVALLCKGHPEIYFIKNNIVETIVRIQCDVGFGKMSDALKADATKVLSPSYGAPLREAMRPYVRPWETPRT